MFNLVYLLWINTSKYLNIIFFPTGSVIFKLNRTSLNQKPWFSITVHQYKNGINNIIIFSASRTFESICENLSKPDWH